MDRFWRNVDRRADDECWPWTGTLTRQGYGQLSIDRRSVRANRLAWALTFGEPPSHLQVCHRCDNPACVNPAHLFLGTAAENQHDKGRKGRAAKGMRNGGGQKLTDDDVRSIRQLLADGMTKIAIARRFGVTRTQIYWIATGRQWSHVT